MKGLDGVELGFDAINELKKNARIYKNRRHRMRFEDRVTVVTGGGNGIGRACCERFAGEGSSVIVADRDTAGVDRTVEAITAAGGCAVGIELDATSRIDNSAMAQLAIDTFGRIDNVVTAAGVSFASYTGEAETEAKRMLERAAYQDKPHLEVIDYDVDGFRTVLDINLIGSFLAVQACAEHMVPESPGSAGSGGSIVTIASIAAKHPDAGPLAYVCSKSAVWMMTKKLARMLAGANIRVNSIGPGFIETNMTQVIELLPPEILAQFMASIPMGRKGQPSDIAAAAAFLCSDDASYMTGEILHPDGGYFTE